MCVFFKCMGLIYRKTAIMLFPEKLELQIAHILKGKEGCVSSFYVCTIGQTGQSDPNRPFQCHFL